jgi:hypothetical protein
MIYDLTENRKKRFTERIAMGTVGNSYSSAQPGHLSCDCPRRVAREGGAGGRVGGHMGARRRCGGSHDNPPWEPDLHPSMANGKVGVAGEYQEEATIVYIHGGATLLPSLGLIKHFSWEILVAEPDAHQREPLRWLIHLECIYNF